MSGKIEHALTDQQRLALSKFIDEKKFATDHSHVGFMSQRVVTDPDKPLNGMAQRLLDKGSWSKDAFLDHSIEEFHLFDGADTEDRERVMDQIARMMSILGIESSDGRLNDAFYGFDPSKLMK
jgi:Domain of unknown function (DUF4844)